MIKEKRKKEPSGAHKTRKRAPMEKKTTRTERLEPPQGDLMKEGSLGRLSPKQVPPSCGDEEKKVHNSAELRKSSEGKKMGVTNWGRKH